MKTIKFASRKTIQMNIITLTQENIEKEHICCALDSKTSNVGVRSKKDWLIGRMQDGLRFKKSDTRGKVFIEYIPAENAWMPIKADGYMHINCHWVSGSYKGKGYGIDLLNACEEDTKQSGMKGVTVVVGAKKKPFLSDKAFYEKHGYKVCDTAQPYFELMVKQFDDKAPLPQFESIAKEGMPNDIKGVDIFYTAQCPFCVPYIDVLKPVIMESDIPVRTYQIKSKEEAQTHFCPVTTYSVFVNGKFYTNEILTAAKLAKLLATLS